MSYEKHTWETGETITAEKLNNLEDGVAEGSGDGGNFVVTFTGSRQAGTWTADKTFTETKNAYDNGQNIIGKYTNEGNTFFMPTIGYSEADEYSAFLFSLVEIQSSAGEITGMINHNFLFMSTNNTVYNMWADKTFN